MVPTPSCCSLNQGLGLICPLQKPSCPVWLDGKGLLISVLGLLPGLNTQCIPARQQEVRAAAHKWAQGFPLSERPKAYQGRREVSPSLPEDCRSRLNPYQWFPQIPSSLEAGK